MKRLYFLIPVFSVPFVLLLMSYHTGSPGGRTGSPGDNGNTCTGCHNGTANSISGWITTNVPTNGYVGGQTYTITATGTHTGVVRFGFELTVEDGQGNKVGTLQVTDATRTKLVNNNKAVTHTSQGITPFGNTNTWSMNWVAPTGVQGDIGIYSAFNAANGNGNTSGDVIYKTSLFISPYVPVPTLVSIVPDSASQGEQVTTLITASDTQFTLFGPDVSLSFSGNPAEVITASNIVVLDDTRLEAVFDIPSDASPGLWDVHVDELILAQAFTINVLSGFREDLARSIRIFPNPASQLFFIENASGAELEIYGAGGGNVLVQRVFSDKQAVDVSRLTRGVYVLRIHQGKESRVEKLLVN